MEWPLNRSLPRGKSPYDSELQKIMDQHGLNREQVRRQLSNYKKKEFKHADIKLTLTSEDGFAPLLYFLRRNLGSNFLPTVGSKNLQEYLRHIFLA